MISRRLDIFLDNDKMTKLFGNGEWDGKRSI